MRTDERLPVSAATPVSDFVCRVGWDDLPEAVRDRAKLCVLDDLCATLAGAPARVAQIAAEYAADAWPGDEATILPRGPRVSALGAAFANGTAANAVDIDDCGVHTWGHPGAQILPAVLAVAQSAGADGRAALTATAVGYEVAFRAARALHDSSETYRACGSWGSVACAAAASSLMRLPAAVAEQALGIAEYNAPFLPMMRDVDHPAMVKHGIGLGAVTGIMSAQLASRGFTGVPPLLHSEHYVAWAEDLGVEWLLPVGIQWKRFSCCAWAHPALEAVARLMAQGPIPPDGIDHVEIRAYDEAARLVSGVPQSTEEAQFSVVWPVAALLVDGEVGPTQVFDARLADPVLQRLAEKVEVVGDAELTRLHALAEDFDPEGKDAAQVIITMTDGRVVDSGLTVCPPLVFERAGMVDKARWLLRPFMTQDATDALIDSVLALDRLSRVEELVTALTEAVARGADPEGVD